MPFAYPWLKKAREYLGQKEIVGPKDNPVIVALWELGKAGNVNDDETPWCAAFVSAVLEQAGIRSARTGWARSYLQWGQKLRYPAVGCVVVFERGSGGHVGFVVGKDQRGNLLVLGGNQSNAVTVAPFTLSRVLGYRWPKEHPLPKVTGFSKLPVIANYAKLSKNEV